MGLWTDGAEVGGPGRPAPECTGSFQNIFMSLPGALAVWFFLLVLVPTLIRSVPRASAFPPPARQHVASQPEEGGGCRGARTLPSGCRASWLSALASGRRWRIPSLGRGHQEVASGGSAGQWLVIGERGRPQRRDGLDWLETGRRKPPQGWRPRGTGGIFQNKMGEPGCGPQRRPRPWAAGLATRLLEGGCGVAGSGSFLRTGLARAPWLGRDRIRGAGRAEVSK